MPGKNVMLSKRALIAALLFSVAQGAAAQGLGVIRQNDDAPLQIESDDGFEWREEEKVYVASGNVRAAQGDIAMYADKVTAHYRDGKDGKNEIWRIDVDGNVRIVSTDETVYADNGVYDVEKGILVFTGSNLALQTSTARLTARDSLEYYDKDRYAVARGAAVATQDDKQLNAGLLVAHLREDANGKTSIYLVLAYDDVHLSTASEIVQCDRAEYNIDTGVATLLGSVKITRGVNQLNGERAEINLKTGVSRIVGGTDGGRVHGFLIPREEFVPGLQERAKEPQVQ